MRIRTTIHTALLSQDTYADGLPFIVGTNINITFTFIRLECIVSYNNEYYFEI